MLNRLSLPSRSNVRVTSPNESYMRGQTLSGAHMTTHNQRRPGIFPSVLDVRKVRDKPSSLGGDKENCRMADCFHTHPDTLVHDGVDSFDPADSRTWGVDSSPLRRSGTIFSHFQGNYYPDTKENNFESQDDHLSLLNSPATSPPSDLEPDSSRFLQMVQDNLQLDTQRPYNTRSPSSSYNSQGNSSTRIHSPMSPGHGNKLSVSDLAKYSHANDRLTNLRSSSPWSERQEGSNETGQYEAMEDASAAITEWRDVPREGNATSYNQFELAESSEVLPTDSLSQFCSPCESTPDSEGETVVNPPRLSEVTTRMTEDNINAIKSQLDGVLDTVGSSSRDVSPEPYRTSLSDSPPRKQSKRKASTFSLRSLTRSFSKRPRINIRKWANAIRCESSRRLSQARQKWKRQTATEKREFESWKANRRRVRPADPLKGKHEIGFGLFSLERSRYGHEGWWRDGVRHYQAPKWMFQE